MLRRALVLAVGCSGLFVGGCGYAEVAPPQAPAPATPQGAEPRTTPPEPGLTRVLLDADGEDAVVTDVVDASLAVAEAKGGGVSATAQGYAETVKPVCITPCFADLAPGLHVLRFSSQTDDRESVAKIQVGERAKVVRHAMGRTEHPFSWVNFTGSVLVYVGAAVAVTGGMMLAVDAGNDSGDPSKGLGLGLGGPVLGAGAGALLIGIPMMIFGRPVRQEGATTELSLAE
jgi:hypothetical protein